MRKALHVAIACGLLLCVAQVGLAQNTNSSDIRGTAIDPSGAVLPGVNVTVTNVDTGVVRDFVTNSDGLYDTNSILPGSYTITFSKDGFQKLVVGPITLQIGLVTVNGDLKVGSSNQIIEVKSDAPILKTEDAQVATSLSTQQLTDLPSVDPADGWTSLLKLLPGATSTPGGTNGGGSGDQNPGVDQAIAGSMPFFSSYLVDGGSIWLPHSANIDQGQSESVAEVNVITSTASAQYGGGGNVFNVISKSGTNQWHGSAYDYLQNDALNARSFFDGASVARLRYNNFGGALGGPILKNKMFFYFNADILVNTNSTTQLVSEPTVQMKQGYFDPAIFGIIHDPANNGVAFVGNQIPTSRMDPVALNIQKFYRDPNISGSQIANNYRYLQTTTNPQRKEFGRLDYNLSAKNRLDFSILQRTSPFHQTAKTNCPVDCQTNISAAYSAQISDVHTVSPTVVNEFRFGYARQDNWVLPASLGKGYPAQIGLQYAKVDLFPTINITGIGANNVLSPQTSAIYIESSFNPSDVVTMIRGRHILHFGAEALMEQDNSTPWGNRNAASLVFNGQFTTSGVGYADFLLGQVQQWTALNAGEAGMRSKNPSFFV